MRIARTVIALAMLGAAPALTFACTPRLEGGKSVTGPRHVLAYRTDPAKVVVGKPFAVDLVVCPKEPGAKIDELRVDAHMPEHRHGMNYKASVKPQSEAGHYRAEGLMFHMPGKWEFLFDVRDAQGLALMKQEYSLK
jgi:hypothetical protein